MTRSSRNLSAILTAAALLLLLAASPGIAQESPPGDMNYQGVLRDDTGAPVNADLDMVFRFWDLESGGATSNEILADSHAAVTISDGMFNVRLGGGVITDGGGSGRYETLADMFRDFQDVWMAVEVRGEVLDPRVKIASSAYALNADHLDGLDSRDFARGVHGHSGSDISGTVAQANNATNADELGGNSPGAFLRSNVSDTFSTGTLRIASGATLDVVGTARAAALEDRDDSAFVLDPNGTSTLATVRPDIIEDRNNTSFFLDLDAALSARTSGNVSIGFGSSTDDDYLYFDGDTEYLRWNQTGTQFSFSDDLDVTGGIQAEGSAYGIAAGGTTAGGYFYDPADTGHAYVGYGDRGIEAYGSNHGGYFEDTDNGGYAYVGYGTLGIEAYGSDVGGAFRDSDGSGYARAGFGDHGVEGYGDDTGGYFEDLTSGSYAYLGYGLYGISALGSGYGGYLRNSYSDGYAYVSYQDEGIKAYGSGGGGYFMDTDNGGYAHVGYGAMGIEAYGGLGGGYFEDTSLGGYAYVGSGWYGIEAYGVLSGGRFEDTSGTGKAWVASADTGIAAQGSGKGGEFTDTDSSAYAEVAAGTYKIYGTGSVNFVQNHPEEQDKVIVYTAPEGDEVATYTRGSGRLENGEARVALGETFRWVTNPDLGLTAHVTPRSPDAGLYVHELSTTELVVRADPDAVQDARFDYIIYGLRIGFEEASVVQVKKREAYIPAMTDHRDLYALHPELRKFNAQERFAAVYSELSGLDRSELNMDNARALRAAVQEYDLAVHGPVVKTDPDGGRRDRPGAESSSSTLAPRHGTTGPAGTTGPPAPAVTAAATMPIDDDGNVYAKSFRPSAADLATMVPVGGEVTAGDVLVIDTQNPGLLKTSDSPADTRVFGIVAAEPGVILGSYRPGEGTAGNTPEVPVTLSGVALCKVDAGYGSIRPGDLLTTSPTAGHAMRTDEPLAGTIVGKALESLEHGTGLVRVLVTLR